MPLSIVSYQAQANYLIVIVNFRKVRPLANGRLGRCVGAALIGFRDGVRNFDQYGGDWPLSNIGAFSLISFQAREKIIFRGVFWHRIPVLISDDIQTDPAGKAIYFLRNLVLAISVPVVAKQKC